MLDGTICFYEPDGASVTRAPISRTRHDIARSGRRARRGQRASPAKRHGRRVAESRTLHITDQTATEGGAETAENRYLLS